MKIERDYRTLKDLSIRELILNPIREFIRDSVGINNVSIPLLNLWFSSVKITFGESEALEPNLLTPNLYQKINITYGNLFNTKKPVPWLYNGSPGLKISQRQARLKFFIKENILLDALEESAIIKGRNTEANIISQIDWVNAIEPIEEDQAYIITVNESEEVPLIEFSKIKEKAISILLDFLGKSSERQFIDLLLERIGLAHVFEQTIVVDGPAKGDDLIFVKYKVKINKLRLSQIPTNIIQTVEDAENLFPNTAKYQVKIVNQIKNITSLVDILQQIERKLNSNKSNIKIENLNIKSEIEKLEKTINHLQRLTTQNLRSSSSEDELILGYSINPENLNDIKYVFLYGQNNNKGFEVWKKIGSLQHKRTVHLFINIEAILLDENLLSPEQFLTKWIKHPDISFSTKTINSTEQQFFQLEDNPTAKTASGRTEEDNLLLRLDIRETGASLWDRYNNIDSSVEQLGVDIKNEISNIKELYDNIFHKISLCKLVTEALTLASHCFDLPFTQFNEALHYGSMAHIGENALHEVIAKLNPEEQFRYEQRYTDIVANIDITPGLHDLVRNFSGRLLQSKDLRNIDVALFALHQEGLLSGAFEKAALLKVAPDLINIFFDPDKCKFHNPFINIFDNLPTINPMGDFWAFILELLKEIFKKIIFTATIDIFGKIKICQRDTAIQSVDLLRNIDRAFKQSSNSSNLEQSNFDLEQEPQLLLTNIEDATIRAFLRDVFNVITTNELIQLLSLSFPENFLKIVNNILQNRYLELVEKIPLANDENIKAFFIGIFNSIPANIRNELIGSVSDILVIPEESFCDDDEDLDERTKKINARNLSFIKSLFRELGNQNNIFDNAFKQKCSESDDNRVMIEVPPPSSMISMQNTAVDSIFDGARSTFKEDVFEYLNSLQVVESQSLTKEEYQRAEEVNKKLVSERNSADINALIKANTRTVALDIAIAPVLHNSLTNDDNFIQHFTNVANVDLPIYKFKGNIKKQNLHPATINQNTIEQQRQQIDTFKQQTISAQNDIDFLNNKELIFREFKNAHDLRIKELNDEFKILDDLSQRRRAPNEPAISAQNYHDYEAKAGVYELEKLINDASIEIYDHFFRFYPFNRLDERPEGIVTTLVRDFKNTIDIFTDNVLEKIATLREGRDNNLNRDRFVPRSHELGPNSYSGVLPVLENVENLDSKLLIGSINRKYFNTIVGLSMFPNGEDPIESIFSRLTNAISVLENLEQFVQTLSEEIDSINSQNINKSLISYLPLQGNQLSGDFETNIQIAIADSAIERPIVLKSKIEIDEEIINFIRTNLNLRQLASLDSNLPPQSQLFGLWSKTIWYKHLETNVPNEFYHYFKDSIFPTITLDFIKKIMLDTSESEFFDKTKYFSFFSILRGPNCGPNSRILEPHDLIDFNSLRTEIIKDITSAVCQKEGSIQEGIKNSIIRFLIRTYIVEALLGTLFLYSKYGFKVANNNIIFVRYLSLLIQRDLQENMGYYKEIIMQLQKNTPESVDDLAMIEKIIFTEIPLIRARFDELFETTFTGIKDYIINNWFPLYDVPSEVSSNRFTTIDPNQVNILHDAVNVEDIIQNYRIERIEAIRGNELPSTRNRIIPAQRGRRQGQVVELNQVNITTQKYNTRHIDLKNGNFILEKFLRIEEKLNPTLGAEIKNRPLHLKGVVNVEAFDKWLLQSSLRNAYLNGNINEFISNNFQSWHLGLRLTYVTPLADFTIRTNNIPNIDINNMFARFKSNIPNAKDLSNKFKAFFLQETIDIERTADVFYHDREIVNIAQVVDKIRLDRPIYTYPMATTELLIEDSFFHEPNPASRLRNLFDLKQLELKTNLQNSIEYKTLIDYLFPIELLTEISAIYNSILTKSSDVQTFAAFDTTKEELRTLVFAASKPKLGEQWYNKENPYIEGRGGSAGILRNDLGNTSIDGPTPTLKRLAKDAQILVLKSIADSVDPSYQLVRGLQSAGAIDVANLSALPLVAPINIFPFGFGPPIGPIGFAALASEPLSGEQRKKEATIREQNNNENQLIQCEEIVIINEEEN